MLTATSRDYFVCPSLFMAACMSVCPSNNTVATFSFISICTNQSKALAYSLNVLELNVFQLINLTLKGQLNEIFDFFLLLILTLFAYKTQHVGRMWNFNPEMTRNSWKGLSAFSQKCLLVSWNYVQVSWKCIPVSKKMCPGNPKMCLSFLKWIISYQRIWWPPPPPPP